MEVSKGSLPAMTNAREGDMNDEEVQQCLLDIASWLQSHAGAIGDDYCGRAPACAAALAELPASAPAVLKVCVSAQLQIAPVSACAASGSCAGCALTACRGPGHAVGARWRNANLRFYSLVMCPD